jgi:hypothetical protein
MEISMAIYNTISVTREEIDQSSFERFEHENPKQIIPSCPEPIQSIHLEIAQTIFSSSYFPLIMSPTILQLDEQLHQQVALTVCAILEEILKSQKVDRNSTILEPTLASDIKAFISFGVQQQSSEILSRRAKIVQGLL